VACSGTVWQIFSAFCHKYRLPVLPAAAKTVRDFVFECVGLRKKPATIRRYVATIGRAHRAAGVLDPTASEEVKLALKEMSRGMVAGQRQARGLVWSEIVLFLTIEPRNLRDIRDRALVTVAYDTKCRRRMGRGALNDVHTDTPASTVETAPPRARTGACGAVDSRARRPAGDS
jgi:hypothetical protein